ncbi:acyl-CoA thioesterase [Psychroserpens sp. S379A]|uniref:acyl-CoA thioesterase n=1 Tax=Psychroserpens sp. S379A TaxID=3415137 RepID=UPI003C7E1E40
MNSTQELLNLIHLNQIDDYNFEGFSKTVGSPNVFGGQVLAQAINAATRTITNGRILHSLHSYFLEPGHLELPIVYNVSIVRDGGSFSVRRVTAAQNGKTIFILSASFQREETGYEHQIDMKSNIKFPEDLLSWTDLLETYREVLPSRVRGFFEIERPIEFKPVQIANPLEKKDLPPFTDVWVKLKGDVSSLSRGEKQQILTYISDYNILTSAINRHASKANWNNTQTASLDHSMWFFRDFDYSDWLLYSIESPNTSNARGFAKGNLFTRDGVLIASVAQEGLMRPK